MVGIEQEQPRGMDTNRLLLIGMLAASILLSVGSAYETFIGLLDFMEPGVIGGAMGLVFTLGVQGLLFVISWSLANHIRDGWRANTWRIAIFVICAIFSGYFSFYGFFESTGGRDEEARLLAVQGLRTEVVRTVEADLSQTLEDGHQSSLIEAPEYRDWKADLEGLVTQSQGAEAEIERNSRAERDRLGDQKRDLLNRIDQLRTDRRTALANVSQSRQRIDFAQQEFERLNASIAALQSQIADQQGEVARLEEALRIELTTGNGQRAADLRLDLNSAQGQLGGLERQLSNAENDRATAVNALNEAEAAALDGAEVKRLNEVDIEIARLEAEIAQTDAKLAETTKGVEFNFDDQMRLLGENIAALERRDYDALDTLIDQCSTIRQQLENAGLGQTVAGYTCQPTPVLQSVQGLRETSARMAAFQSACRETRPGVARAADGARYVIEPLFDHMLSCAEFAPSIDTQESLVRRIAAAKTQRGDAAEPIRQGSIALFADRQGNAVISAIFASFIDILVLLCALVGKNVGLPERARGIDKLLNAMRIPQPARPGVEAVAVLPTNANEMALLQPLLDQLLRDDLIDRERDETGAEIAIFRTGAKRRLKQLRRLDVMEDVEDIAKVQTTRGRPAPYGGAPRRPI